LLAIVADEHDTRLPTDARASVIVLAARLEAMRTLIGSAAPIGWCEALLVLAARHMGRGAAAVDRTHDLHLVEADVPGIGATPRRPVVAEYIRDLQLWAGHDRGCLRRRRQFSPAQLQMD
jgi:hypothetical protein